MGNTKITVRTDMYMVPLNQTNASSGGNPGRPEAANLEMVHSGKRCNHQGTAKFLHQENIEIDLPDIIPRDEQIHGPIKKMGFILAICVTEHLVH